MIVSVGAGFTVAAKLPGWSDLLAGMAKDCHVDIDTSCASDATQFEIVKKGGRRCACEAMRQRLCDKPETPHMKQRLDALFALPAAAVITWNWDDLLESRCRVVRHEWQPGFGVSILSARGSKDCTPLLLKLQGSLDVSDGAVVGPEDYVRVRPVRDAFLRQLYHGSGYVVLHIGQGVSKFISGGGVVGPVLREHVGNARHYALVNDVTEAEQVEALKCGIVLINYDSSNHTRHQEALCGFLNDLTRSVP